MLKLFKSENKKAVLTFMFGALLILTCCGKRKPPLPPVEKIPQKVEISGVQRGNQIILTWTLPARNAPDGRLLKINLVNVYRLAEPFNAPLTLSEEEFYSRSNLIATQSLNASDFARRNLTFTDTLNFAGQAARLRYAIRFVNDTGQKAAFSNFLLIEPTAKVADRPQSLTSKITQDKIILNWTPPPTNIDGSTPANILGYNIYRTETEKVPVKMLNKTPITSDTFADETFEFEKNYAYFVRTVSLGSNGEPLESSDSLNMSVTPKDVFPPSPPGAITIAASPQAISIFFATNIENDVVGYRLYRSTDPNLPKNQWLLVNKDLLTVNSFQDTQVESGRTYYYFLTAVDKFGNISENSPVVSETVP